MHESPDPRAGLNSRVLGLLNRIDPWQLEPGAPGSLIPEDEYGYEAEAIAEHLAEEGTIGVADVDEIWNHWFSQPLTGLIGCDAADQLVGELDRLVDR